MLEEGPVLLKVILWGSDEVFFAGFVEWSVVCFS